MTTDQPDQPYDPPSKSGDLAYGAFYSAAIGGSAVALMFLVIDLVMGRPLFTPSLLGATLFFDVPADTYSLIDLRSVTFYSVVHFAAFAALGFIGSFVYQRVFAANGPAWPVTAITIFLLGQGGFLLASATVMPGAADRLGHVLVVASNVLAAATMAAFMRWAYRQNPTAEQTEAARKATEREHRVPTA